MYCIIGSLCAAKSGRWHVRGAAGVGSMPNVHITILEFSNISRASSKSQLSSQPIFLHNLGKICI